MEDLYEPVEPYEFGELKVGDGQTLYWETVGAPDGLPAVWLHGGPRSGCTHTARRHFDPSVYRAVLFDQRGCGRSRPLVSEPDAANPAFRTVFARLVTHYWSHDCFLADGEVLAGMTRLDGIPGVLIHGRYDVSSPLDIAWAVHRAWAGSQLVVVGDAGHGGASLWGQLTAGLDSFRGMGERP